MWHRSHEAMDNISQQSWWWFHNAVMSVHVLWFWSAGLLKHIIASWLQDNTLLPSSSYPEMVWLAFWRLLTKGVANAFTQLSTFMGCYGKIYSHARSCTCKYGKLWNQCYTKLLPFVGQKLVLHYIRHLSWFLAHQCVCICKYGENRNLSDHFYWFKMDT